MAMYVIWSKDAKYLFLKFPSKSEKMVKLVNRLTEILHISLGMVCTELKIISEIKQPLKDRKLS